MPLTVEEQSFSILQFLCFGAACGAAYDCFRILRVCFGLTDCSHIPVSWKNRTFPLIGAVGVCRSPVPRGLRLFLVGIGDVLFSLAAGIGYSVCLFAAGSGIFRWYTLAAAGTGCLLYSVLPGRAVRFLSDSVACLLHVLGRYFLWLILYPLRLTARFCIRLGVWMRMRCVIPICSHLSFLRRAVYTRRVEKRLIHDVQSFGKEHFDEQLEK